MRNRASARGLYILLTALRVTMAIKFISTQSADIFIQYALQHVPESIPDRGFNRTITRRPQGLPRTAL
jgi:hypothetical protein